MRFVVASDHSGFPLKGPVSDALRAGDHEVVDVGTFSTDRVDFPDVAEKACRRVLLGEADRAVLICGSGIGMSIAANKFPGIRAALCHDTYSAHQCVEHDNASVLCMGAQIIGEKAAIEVLNAFVGARFSDDDYFRARDVKLTDLERRLKSE